jgi:hypothetical protein
MILDYTNYEYTVWDAMDEFEIIHDFIFESGELL